MLHFLSDGLKRNVIFLVRRFEEVNLSEWVNPQAMFIGLQEQIICFYSPDGE